MLVIPSQIASFEFERDSLKIPLEVALFHYWSITYNPRHERVFRLQNIWLIGQQQIPGNDLLPLKERRRKNKWGRIKR